MSAPNITLQDDLTPLAAELATVQDTIAHFQLTEASLKTKIRELTATSGPDKYAAGGLTVVISNNSRYDAKLAMTLVGEHLWPLVVENVATVNKDKLKVLRPDLFALAQTYGDARVSLK